MNGESASARTSGSHVRPADHTLTRSGRPFEPRPSAGGPEHTRARPASEPTETTRGNGSDRTGQGPSAGATDGAGDERRVTLSDGGDTTAEPGGSESEYDGYRHTQHEPVRPEVRGDVGPLIAALHEIFERDRGVASQGASARCGICYLHYPLAELAYRDDEGFYVCAACTKALGHSQVFMVRRQQK
jgi:hypothetical protein